MNIEDKRMLFALLIVVGGAAWVYWMFTAPPDKKLSTSIEDFFSSTFNLVWNLLTTLIRWIILGLTIVGGLASLFSMIASIIRFEIGMALLFCFLAWLCWVVFRWLKK